MSSNWMFNNGLDDDEEPSSSSKRMSRKKAKRVRDVSRKSTYGGYVYDYDDRKAAQETLGNEYWE
jgi:hypothetical protein